MKAQEGIVSGEDDSFEFDETERHLKVGRGFTYPINSKYIAKVVAYVNCEVYLMWRWGLEFVKNRTRHVGALYFQRTNRTVVSLRW